MLYLTKLKEIMSENEEDIVATDMQISGINLTIVYNLDKGALYFKKKLQILSYLLPNFSFRKSSEINLSGFFTQS